MFKKLTKFSLNQHSQHSGDTRRSCEEQIKDVCGRVAAHRSDKMAAVTLSVTLWDEPAVVVTSNRMFSWNQTGAEQKYWGGEADRHGFKKKPGLSP